MKRLVIAGVMAAAAAGCLDFDQQLADACDAGRWPGECGPATGGGTSTGGGTTTGGGSTTGGGDGVTGGGSATGGGAAMDGGSDAGCIGRGAWCWEAPSRLGAMELNAIWGRSETEVYVAGGGGALLLWDGVTWRQLPFAPDMVEEGEAVVRVLQPRGDGLVLAGDRMRLYVPNASGAWTPTSVLANRWSGSTLDDTTTVLRGDLNGAGTLDTVSPTATVTTTSTVPVDGIFEAVLRHDSGVYLAFSSPDGAGMQLDDGGLAVLHLDGGFISGSPTTFATLGGRPVMLFTDGRALGLEADGSWRELPRFPLQGPQPQTHQFIEHDDGGVDWWATGQSLSLFLNQNFGGTSVELGTPGPEWGRASWVSPQGQLWAVGASGRVVRARGTTPDTLDELGSLPDGVMDDLDVDGDTVIAVGERGVRWVRSNGVWTRSEDATGGTAYGVAISGGRWCTVHHNRVRCAASLTANPMTARLISVLDGGTPAGSVRAGVVRFSPDGRLRAGVGGAVTFQLRDGGWADYAPGLGLITSDMVADDDGAWVAFNQPQGGTYMRDGVVAYVRENGTVARTCALPTFEALRAVYALARTDGGVLAAGGGWAGVCGDDGGYAGYDLSLLPGPTFTSVFEDEHANRWLLAIDGRVYRSDAGEETFSRDRAPASWSATATPAAVRITGGGGRLYVGIGHGAVMQRPVP